MMDLGSHMASPLAVRATLVRSCWLASDEPGRGPGEHCKRVPDGAVRAALSRPPMECQHCWQQHTYLIWQARTVAEGIIASVALMEQSGLPCYGRGKPMANLRKRFCLDLNEAQAAAFMLGKINGAYDNVRTVSGWLAVACKMRKVTGAGL